MTINIFDNKNDYYSLNRYNVAGLSLVKEDIQGYLTNIIKICANRAILEKTTTLITTQWPRLGEFRTPRREALYQCKLRRRRNLLSWAKVKTGPLQHPSYTYTSPLIIKYVKNNETEKPEVPLLFNEKPYTASVTGVSDGYRTSTGGGCASLQSRIGKCVPKPSGPQKEAWEGREAGGPPHPPLSVLAHLFRRHWIVL